MSSGPYWINLKLAIVPRPRGGKELEDEMAALKEDGIDVVVSMLQAGEAADLGLEREAEAARLAGLEFINFPMPDGSVPADKNGFEEFLAGLEGHLAAGRKVGVHCRACIGRASVTAASLLMRSGVPAQRAWLQIVVARGFAVPDTAEQREWVEEHMVRTA